MKRIIHKILKAGCAAALCFLLSAGGAAANVMLGENDWDPGPHSWVSSNGWTTLGYPTTGGNTGGWMSITFPYTATPEYDQDEWYDIIRTSPTNIYSGSWTTSNWVQFDFWASNASPTYIQVQWRSSTNANIWGAVLTPPTTQTWTTLSASFENWLNWDYPGATLDQYLSDLSGINWIGVYVYRAGDQEQIYGIDNFQLWIPEPAEMAMLAVALTTSVMSWRKRRKKKNGPEDQPPTSG